MHISLETPELHAIQSYSDTQIQINSIVYERSLIVSREEIITDLRINNISAMNEEYIQFLVQLKPELIIIGHQNSGVFPPMQLLAQLYQQQIGIECMPLGSACRTYNLLLSENRAVVGGFIL